MTAMVFTGKKRMIMFTVLLVDDELPIVEALETQIPWQQFGINTLLKAYDGVQAWNQIEKQRVDLLITDIRMPQMDGLELLQKVRVSCPETHCILLSAYGEFEYARTAIQYGVENYLMKPFRKDELEETIEKALDNIYSSRQNSDRLFFNNIMVRWAGGSISSEELSERSSLLGINIYMPYYCAVCVKMLKKNHSVSALYTACQKIFAPDYECYHFVDNNNRNIFLAGGADLSQEVLISRLKAVLTEQDMASSFAFAIGIIVRSSDAVFQSYQSACGLSDTADLAQSPPHFTAAGENLPLNTILLDELLALFCLESEELRTEGYQKIAHGISSYPQDEWTALLSLLTKSLFQLFSQEFPNKRESQKQLQSRNMLFTVAVSNEDLVSAIVAMLEYSFLLYRYYFDQLSPVTQYAIDYVRRYYAKGLSLKEICAKNKMNPNYLGFLFKKETGMFFNNYLSQYRICCSFQLLRDTGKKVSDIARQVGFSSTSYYISCFKKQTGLSPVKYRSLLTTPPKESRL